MKAIYVGAGTDLRPIKFFPRITEFVYIDCQPFSEFGIKQCGIIRKCEEFGEYDGFSRPGFLPKLENKMEKYKMKLVSVDGNERIYKNDTQTIRYLINTSVPEHYDYIKSKNPYFDIIIISGHSPNSKIMDFAKNNVLLLGSSYSSFSSEDRNFNIWAKKFLSALLCGLYSPKKTHIINDLHINVDLKKKFNKFCYYDSETGKNEIFNTWDEYYTNYKIDNKL